MPPRFLSAFKERSAQTKSISGAACFNGLVTKLWRRKWDCLLSCQLDDAFSNEEIFRILDTEGQGKIDKQTFAEGIQQIGLELSSEEIDEIFEHILTGFNVRAPPNLFDTDMMESPHNSGDEAGSPTTPLSPLTENAITQVQFRLFMNSGGGGIRRGSSAVFRIGRQVSDTSDEKEMGVVDRFRSNLENKFLERVPSKEVFCSLCLSFVKFWGRRVRLQLSNVSDPVEKLEKCEELLQIYESCVFRLSSDEHVKWQNVCRTKIRKFVWETGFAHRDFLHTKND